jgi:hypothetical protein
MAGLIFLVWAFMFAAFICHQRARHWRKVAQKQDAQLDRYEELCISLTMEVDQLRALPRPPTQQVLEDALEFTDEAEYVAPLLVPIKSVHVSGKIAQRSDHPLLN